MGASGCLPPGACHFWVKSDRHPKINDLLIVPLSGLLVY